MVKVLFFGPVAEGAGRREVFVAFREGMRWQDVRDEMQSLYPVALAQVAVCAVNGEQVFEDTFVSLPDESEVVFMSRFSGG